MTKKKTVKKIVKKHAIKRIKRVVKRHRIKKIKRVVKVIKRSSREIVLTKPMTKALVVYKPTHKKILTGIRDVENTTRDFINWLAVFRTEYSIPTEAYETLHDKMDEFSTKVGAITCDVVGTIDKSKIKLAANTLRDTKVWLAVFAREYDIASEAVCVLTEKLDEVGEKLANVDCK
ncbi:MAG: hypothetical protein AABX98_06180 [Nanoarchaeota archaeon]